MTLVDTSVWVDHLRSGNEALAALLEAGDVVTHPFVVGELACGNLQHRSTVIGLLKHLPQSAVATDEEVLFFIERHELMGRGIGYIDAHLLAAASLSDTVDVWTRDRRLHAVAEELDLASSL